MAWPIAWCPLDHRNVDPAQPAAADIPEEKYCGALSVLIGVCCCPLGLIAACFPVDRRQNDPAMGLAHATNVADPATAQRSTGAVAFPANFDEQHPQAAPGADPNQKDNATYLAMVPLLLALIGGIIVPAVPGGLMTLDPPLVLNDHRVMKIGIWQNVMAPHSRMANDGETEGACEMLYASSGDDHKRCLDALKDKCYTNKAFSILGMMAVATSLASLALGATTPTASTMALLLRTAATVSAAFALLSYLIVWSLTLSTATRKLTDASSCGLREGPDYPSIDDFGASFACAVLNTLFLASAIFLMTRGFSVERRRANGEAIGQPCVLLPVRSASSDPQAPGAARARHAASWGLNATAAGCGRGGCRSTAASCGRSDRRRA